MLHVPSVLSHGSGMSDASTIASPNKGDTPGSNNNNNGARSANNGTPVRPPLFNHDHGDSSDASDTEAAGFDVLDEVPKHIHAHFVGMNRDASRIYVGHDYGLTVWILPTPLEAAASPTGPSAPAASAAKHFTVTLRRMFGRQWADLGGKGYVFCASVLKRTDYFVVGAKSRVGEGAAATETEELFVLHGREVRHKWSTRIRGNLLELFGKPTSPGQQSQIADQHDFHLREVHIEQDRIFVVCANSFHLFDLSGRTLFCSKAAVAAPPPQGMLQQTLGKAVNAVSSTVGAIGGWLGFGGSSSIQQQEAQKQQRQQQQQQNEASGSAVSLTSLYHSSDYRHPMQCGLLSVLRPTAGQEEPFHSVVAAAFPGTTPGSFTVIDWSSSSCSTLKRDVVAHTGHLASLVITSGSASGTIKLLAVTASTTGTTCRVFDALAGTKLRTLRMTTPGPDGSCLPSFRLRGVEVDGFGRVIVLCQDSATSSSSSAAASSSALGEPSPTTTTAPAPPSSVRGPSLEVCFFDCDGGDDGLAPVAGEHVLNNTSFASRAVTAGVTLAAGKRAADAADALRPLSRAVLPLRPGASPLLGPQQSPGAGQVTDELISMLALSVVPGACAASHSPDQMTVAVARIHSSGVRSIAQVTFGALPRETTMGAVTSAMENNGATASTGRLGAEVREAKSQTGASKIDVLRQF